MVRRIYDSHETFVRVSDNVDTIVSQFCCIKILNMFKNKITFTISQIDGESLDFP